MKFPARSKSAAAVAATLILVAGCSQPVTEPDNFVRGSISYAADAQPAPDAELVVKLLDVSLADAKASELATTTIVNPGPSPVDYAIEYEPADIISDRSYVVRATLYAGGQMLFTTDTAYPVLTRGADKTANLNLITVQRTAEQQASSLAGTRWELVQIDDQLIELDPNQRRPFILLATENNAVSGNAGCNSFAGTYAQEDDELTLGPLAITAMACIDSMETEQMFTERLAKMNRYEIIGSELRFYGDETLLLAFKPREENEQPAAP